MNQSEILDRMINPGVLAVIRAASHSQLDSICDALLEGGVCGLEITMSTPDALGAIEKTAQRLGSRALVGVGSVLDETTARLAILAGAQFVVTPVCRPAIIRVCQRYAKPVVCGAYTPTEALTAHEEGADFIKIFPADGLGPGYIKALLAPLPILRIIPTGGVDRNTCADFIRAGCVAVAAGGSLMPSQAVAAGDWKTITETAAAFVRNVAAARAA